MLIINRDFKVRKMRLGYDAMGRKGFRVAIKNHFTLQPLLSTILNHLFSLISLSSHK